MDSWVAGSSPVSIGGIPVCQSRISSTTLAGLRIGTCKALWFVLAHCKLAPTVVAQMHRNYLAAIQLGLIRALEMHFLVSQVIATLSDYPAMSVWILG